MSFKIFRSFALVSAFVLCGVLSAAEAPSKGMKQGYDFLKEAKVYYIATVEKDQPHVRPFGTVHILQSAARGV